ncbi:MAG: glycosyltransferase family 4 protein [Anaerolineae bacterium]|nr:glycosyltransferase family 4 protein [Anaerolineae bacterium]
MHVGIIHYAAPPIVGGVELTIFHHARTLTVLGHQVTIAAGLGDAVVPGVNYRQEALFGSRHPAIMEVGRALADGNIPANFGDLVTQTKQALLKSIGNCDVVIGHNFFTLHKNLVLTAAVYHLIRNGEGPPWVAWHHDFAWLRSQYQSELHPGEPWELLKHPWPNVRHVTVSHAQQDDLAQLYGLPLNDIIVVSPGVEPAEFYRCDETVTSLVNRWDLLGADCVFLLPARVTRRKNIELGLEWLAAVRQQSGWDARLIITGPPGPHNPTNDVYLEYLLALRDKLQLHDAAHFVYQLRYEEGVPIILLNEDLANLYQIVDALFFPSRQEGFGIPILEAGLARLPIFATDLPPFRESAGPEARLFALDTPADQVAHTIIETLQADRAFQLRRRVLEQFTWRGIVKTRILPLLEEVIS